jgi:hypothetical protein
MMPTVTRLAAALALIGVSATWAPAQERSSKTQGTTSVHGVVRDTARSPIEGAEVIVHIADRTASTSPAGVFRLDALSPGRYWITVRRVGYVPLRAALTLESNQDREIVFELDAMTLELPEIQVWARETWWARRFREFTRRQKTALGRFVTRDDIERMRPAYLADLVQRYFPFNRFDGFQPSWPAGRGASWTTAVFGRSSRFSNCSPSISLNGGVPMSGWAVNDFHPEAVEALEIYRRSSEIPVDLQMPGQSSGCGVVVVWLRQSSN